jgi:hypothetical protein
VTLSQMHSGIGLPQCGQSAMDADTSAVSDMRLAIRLARPE